MNKAKVNFWVDAAIGIAFVLSAISGVVFLLPGNSTGGVLGISLRLWNDIHTVSSLAMIVGVGLHLVLHWRWIITMARRMLPIPRRQAQTRLATGTSRAAEGLGESVHTDGRMSRRDFLFRAGAATAGAALLLTGSKALLGWGDSSASPPAGGTSATEEFALESGGSLLGDRELSVACPFGVVNDPYPGRCRRYSDPNRNGICDFSEPGLG